MVGSSGTKPVRSPGFYPVKRWHLTGLKTRLIKGWMNNRLHSSVCSSQCRSLPRLKLMDRTVGPHMIWNQWPRSYNQGRALSWWTLAMVWARGEWAPSGLLAQDIMHEWIPLQLSSSLSTTHGIDDDDDDYFKCYSCM